MIAQEVSNQSDSNSAIEQKLGTFLRRLEQVENMIRMLETRQQELTARLHSDGKYLSLTPRFLRIIVEVTAPLLRHKSTYHHLPLAVFFIIFLIRVRRFPHHPRHHGGGHVAGAAESRGDKPLGTATTYALVTQQPSEAHIGASSDLDFDLDQLHGDDGAAPGRGRRDPAGSSREQQRRRAPGGKATQCQLCLPAS